MKDSKGLLGGLPGVWVVFGLLLPLPASGGLLLRQGTGPAREAPLLETEVEVEVTGVVARTRVRQIFVNQSDLWLEGTYVFPLPELSAVDTLRMRVGTRVFEGRIQERTQARQRFAAAKREGRRASLVEQQRPNLFQTSLANVGPSEEVEIEIEYQQLLRYERSGFELRVPLVAAPRYASTNGEAEAGEILPGTTLLPASDPTAERSNRVWLQVDLDPGVPLAVLESPSHELLLETVGRRHRVFVEAVLADRDFVLRWEPTAGSAPVPALFTEEHGGEIYLLLVFFPPAREQASSFLDRETVFVLDTSGSMGGQALRQARQALELALGRLDSAEWFNVIEFDVLTRSLFPRSVRAEPRNVEEARRFVASLSAGGGTEMLPALQRAFEGDEGVAAMRRVIFLTDGAIGNEAELFGAIQQGMGRSRLFTIGIGSAPNAYFLSRAARTGRGSYTPISQPGEVAARMQQLFTKLENPVLGDLEVHWNDAVEMWPNRLPDLYLDEPLVVTARIPRFVGEIAVSGRSDGAPWEVRLPLSPGAPGRGVEKLWARRKIAALLDELGSGGDREALRAEVLEVALAHGLVSRFTSLVAEDVTPIRPRSAGATSFELARHLPAGSTLPGVLPATATPGPLLRLLGALGLGAAALLGMRGRARS